MSFSNEYSLNVDIKKRLSNVVPVFRQGDTAILHFKVYDDGLLYDLSDYTRSELVFSLPSGKTIIGEGTLTNGTITYQFLGIEMAEVGTVSVILSIYSNETVVSVQPFHVHIYDNMLDEEISYVTILQDLIAEVTSLTTEVAPILEILSETQGNINTMLQDISDNEDERSENELLRSAYEDDRISSENQRKQQEITRQSNEDTRIQNENNRISKESLRVTAESNRVSNEATRVSNESNRVIAEGLRVDRENSRISNESTRQSNETTRQSNESSRNNAEVIRSNNENIREINENNRANAETERELAEQQRIINENNRIQSIDNHISDEVSHITRTERINWNAKATLRTYTDIIPTSWSGTTAPYTQIITINGISAEDNPIISPILSDTISTAILQQKSYDMISKATTSTNTITFICFEEKPTIAIPIQVMVVI